MIRTLPRLVLAGLCLPMLAGLAISFSAAGPAGFGALVGWSGLVRASLLSVGTGFVATAIALVASGLILAMLYDRASFRPLRRVLSPLLALPHAAAALGLAFIIAPSGWIVRLLSPWATGWQVPPDILLLNDPLGLALVLGLVAKEVPFLLLMGLAALPHCAPGQRLTAAAALGHGRLSGFAVAVWPPLYARLRLPVLAVLAYGMTTVDMAMVLGPTLPPTLSVQITRWMTDPGLQHLPTAAAAALWQMALVGLAMALWRGVERGAATLLARHIGSGRRRLRADRPARIAAELAGFGLAGGMALSLLGLALWSVAGDWPFPAAVPRSLTPDHWSRALPGLSVALGRTLAIALGATAAAALLVIAWLEAESRHPQGGQAWGEQAVYLPLLVPQIAVLPGLQVIALRLGVEGTVMAVATVHLIFVLPYVFLSLAPAWRNWDDRHALTAATLGAGANRMLWHIRLPMLLGPLLTAFALGLAVSVGQYLPTLLIGGGRITTLTTEAVALSSGGNRKLVGVWAFTQLALPALGFALALMVPKLVFANRRALSHGTSG